VEPSTRARSALIKAIQIVGTQAELARLIGYDQGSVSLWKLGKRWIPLDVLKMITKITGSEADDLIYKHKLRGQNPGTSMDDGTIELTAKMTCKKARLVGWILTDGNLHSQRNIVTVVQKCKAPLERLIQDFRDEFRMGRSHFGIYRQGKRYWRLVINSAPLKQLLSLHFGVHIGDKCTKVKVPKEIFNANRKAKMAFVTAVLEGDGSFTSTKIRGKRYPLISLQSKSRKFILEMKKLFRDLGFHPAQNNSHTRNHFGLALKRREEVAKFIVESYPFLIHNRKKERAGELLQLSQEAT